MPLDAELLKRVAPTAVSTAVPPILSYISSMADWKTSQPYFQAGWNEHNPRYTKSGLPSSEPVSYDDGARLVKTGALKVLGRSALNSAGTTLATQLLDRQFPTHKKLINTLGMVGQAALNGRLAYNESSQHFKQTGWNKSNIPQD